MVYKYRQTRVYLPILSGASRDTKLIQYLIREFSSSPQVKDISLCGICSRLSVSFLCLSQHLLICLHFLQLPVWACALCSVKRATAESWGRLYPRWKEMDQQTPTESERVKEESIHKHSSIKKIITNIEVLVFI